METRNIIVIGASAGGFDALKTLVKDLPPDLLASIFVVWHMSPDVTGILPQVLERNGALPAKNAEDGEKIRPNQIYVAPPDHHLLVVNSHVRVTRGPKENRFRPAVDPLFRSAAYSYGARVIGVILTGALDDGTSGLWAVKHHGGVAVVQDPSDAEIPSMPLNAMREVEIDHIVPVSEMADLLVRLSREPLADSSEEVMEDDKQTAFEVGVAGEDKGTMDVMKFGAPTPYTCPECHGVLFQLRDGNRPRYRCHTGHAFSSDSLLASVTESIEESLWSAIRCIEESVILLNHLGRHFSENGQTDLAALYYKKALEAQERGNAVRQPLMEHERLSADSVRVEAGDQTGSEKFAKGE